LLKLFQNASDVIALRKSVGEPGSGTHSPTGDVLETHLIAYRKLISARNGRTQWKKRLFIVITDGEASKSPFRPFPIRVDNEQLPFFTNQVTVQKKGSLVQPLSSRKILFPLARYLIHLASPPRNVTG